ncbi:MAG: HEAT repeat domain-containing protein [Candidatus Rifleibacteriota bacterium]
MSNAIESTSLQDFQIKLLLEELNSTDPFSRQYAISQLQNFTDNPTVIDGLKKRFEIEDNTGCKADLDEVLKLIEAPEADKEPATTVSADQIIEQWCISDAVQLQRLSRQLKKMGVDEQVQVICSIFSRVKNAGQIMPILSLSRRVLAKDQVLPWIEKLLATNHTLLLIRAISILTRLKPTLLIKHLPRLLVHENLQIRLLAIKALHLLAPAEAIRLLNELMFSADVTNRRSAFSFLFLLPFSDTGDIVLRLIEGADLPQNIDLVISYLIYNNPDFNFFRRISISYLLHGRRIARLKTYWETAAKSLLISKLTDKPEEELKRLALEEARKFIQDHSSHKLTEEETTPAISPEKTTNKELEKFLTAKTFSSSDEKNFFELLAKLSTDEEKLSAIRLISEKQLKSPEASNWLEGLVDKQSSTVVVACIDALARVNKNRLLPHLPLLAFSEHQKIADSAVSIFNKEFPDKFMDKLKTWIKDGRPEIRHAAYKGLMQIEFLKARDMILGLFKTSSNSETIKFYGSILVLNPDTLTIHKLRQISEKLPTERRNLLNQLAEKIKTELGEKGKPDSGAAISEGLGEQWEDILGSIKKISYESQDLTFGELLQSKLFSLILIAILIIGGILFVFKFRVKDYTEGKKTEAPVEKTVFSYSVGNSSDVPADIKAERPWDFQPPDLATPATDLFKVMTIEEKQQQHQELLEEYGPKAEELPSGQENIRLEIEYK